MDVFLVAAYNKNPNNFPCSPPFTQNMLGLRPEDRMSYGQKGYCAYLSGADADQVKAAGKGVPLPACTLLAVCPSPCLLCIRSPCLLCIHLHMAWLVCLRLPAVQPLAHGWACVPLPACRVSAYT